MSKKSLSEGFKSAMLQNRIEYDSISLAIKLAKSMDIDRGAIEDLSYIKQGLKDSWTNQCNKVLRRMTLSNNIVKLSSSWYAIRYSDNSGSMHLVIEPLNEDDVDILRRDGRREGELTRRGLDELLPACLDEVELEHYKVDVRRRAESMLPPVIEEQEDNPVPEALDPIQEQESVLEELEGTGQPKVTVSSHACIRYIQRVLKIGTANETIADNYRKSNLGSILAQILEGFSTAEQVWVEEAPDGVFYYYFGDNNLMYVVGNNNIITLYEEDFGFSKDINRMITLEQIGVLSKAKDELRRQEEDGKARVDALEQELMDLDQETEVLQAKMELLESRKSTLSTSKVQINKETRMVQQVYYKEFNKLFKRWDG